MIEPATEPAPKVTPLRHRPVKRKRRKPVVAGILLVLAVVAALAFAVWALRGDPTTAAAKYTTSEASKQTLVVTVSASGNMVVNDQQSVTPQVSGTVSHLNVSLGDKVKTGQTLYTISNPSLATAVTRARGSWRQAQQSLQRAELELEKAQQARDALDSPPKGKTVTQDDIDNADAQIEIAETGVKAAKNDRSAAYDSYQQAEDDYDSRTVKAPMDGLVTQLTLTEGGSTSGSSSSSSNGSSGSGGSNGSSSGSSSSSSGSSSSGSLVIADLSSLRARVAVNEVDMPSVKVGQKASLTFDAIDGLTLAGKVVKVALSGTNSNGVVTYDVDIVPTALDPRVRPNMSCSAAITTNVRPDVIAVPNAAVKSDTSGDYVQVLGSDGTSVQRVDVTVGASNDSYTEIKEGVSAGQSVVTQSSSSGSSGSGSSGNRSGNFMFGGGGGVMMRGGN